MIVNPRCILCILLNRLHDVLRDHMAWETLICHHTHEEERGVGFASSLFTFQLCVLFRYDLLRVLPMNGRFNQCVWST